MKKVLALLLVVVMIIGITACKGNDNGENPESETPAATTSPSAKPSETADPTTEPEPSEEPSESPEPSEEPEESFRVPDPKIRPWTVSIDNQGEIPFPQSGLADAQIVYEIPVEGGVTRYVAMFWNASVDLIGPVRSARDYMIDVVMPFDGILVHFGGSPQALQDIQNDPEIETLNAMMNAGSIFEDLTDDPKNWQDSYTTGEKIKDFLESKGMDTEAEVSALPEYNDEIVIPSEGMGASMISITYSDMSRCAYIFDETRQVYFRNRDGAAHVDKNDGAPFEVANIIIQKVETRKITGDTEGRLEVDMIGSGEGYFITGGKAIEITWEKTERFGPTKYYDGEGKEIILNPGNTWIQITNAETAILIL